MTCTGKGAEVESFYQEQSKQQSTFSHDTLLVEVRATSDWLVLPCTVECSANVTTDMSLCAVCWGDLSDMSLCAVCWGDLSDMSLCAVCWGDLSDMSLCAVCWGDLSDMSLCAVC